MRDPNEQDLTPEMAVMAVTHLLERRSDGSLNRLVRPLERNRDLKPTIAGQTAHPAQPILPGVGDLNARLETA